MVFKWGVAGAAVATIIAQVVASLYCIRIMLKTEYLKIDRSEMTIEHNFVYKLLKLAAPMAFQNTIIAFGGMVVQLVVNGYGVAFIAGFTATTKLYGILEIAATSYGYSMVTYTGQNLGAGKNERISSGLRAGLLIGIFTSLLISLLMFVFGKDILSLFISLEDEGGFEALEIAFNYEYFPAGSLSYSYYQKHYSGYGKYHPADGFRYFGANHAYQRFLYSACIFWPEWYYVCGNMCLDGCGSDSYSGIYCQQKQT